MIQQNEYKQAERLLKQFKDSDFQLPLQKMKRELVNYKGKQVHKDLYLCQKLFPALLQGLQELAKEVEQHMSHSDQIDEEVANRFNPCIFLAQYLMRNNQNTKKGCQTTLNKLFKGYVRQQRFSRFVLKNFDSISKVFIRSLKKDKKMCDIAQMKIFARQLDQLLGFKGSLRDWLTSCKSLNKTKGQINLHQIVDEIAKYCAANQHISEQDFLKAFKN